MWALDGGGRLASAEGRSRDEPGNQRIERLAVHGGKVITGSKCLHGPSEVWARDSVWFQCRMGSDVAAAFYSVFVQVCVWSLDTLSLEHVLPQPSGGVGALVAAGDCVLGGVGNEAVVWGAMKSAGSLNYNVSVVSYASSMDELSRHPGYSIKPLWWCLNPKNQTPVSGLFFSTATSAGLADSLLQLSTAGEDDPAARAFTQAVFASTVIIEQNMTTLDVVDRGGVSLVLTLLLTGPPFPSHLGVPPPSSVTLDLAGCLSCISLSNSTAHVYIFGLSLTGLERPAVSSNSSSSSGNGTQLTLPLWAFQFNRSSASPSVTLHNVTLTLPQEEFRLLLVGLLAGAGPAGAGQLQPLQGFQVKVRSGR